MINHMIMIIMALGAVAGGIDRIMGNYEKETTGKASGLRT